MYVRVGSIMEPLSLFLLLQVLDVAIIVYKVCCASLFIASVKKR